MATGMMQAKPEGSGTYTYSSHPRAVQQGKKYRDQSACGNIMYDKRIVRGNTYALHTLPASSQPDPLELQKQQESRRRALARKRAREQFKPRSPEPVEGRKHIEVQTELYLEEITDRVEESDVQTQTDAFLERPSTPLFVPAKTGMDAATQIEEGDLFDFDLEVRPILEVLVGKTVEQALLEVMEEEELASLRAQQRCFEENRNAEVVETQRLEEQERRRREEKDRRMQQQREALLKEKETAEKIAARAFAQSYLADLVPSVFSTLNQNGFFYDPVEREVETVFIPFLMEETGKSLNKKLVARIQLDAIIRRMVANKLGIEYVEREPVMETPPAPPTQATQSESQQQQQEEKELPQIFGDQTKQDDEGKEGDEGKQGEPETVEYKETTETNEGESEGSAVETKDGNEVDPSTAETKETSESDQPQTEKTESTEKDVPSGEGEKDSEVTTEETPPITEETPPITEESPPTAKEIEAEQQEADKKDENTKVDEESPSSESQETKVDNVDTTPVETSAESTEKAPAELVENAPTDGEQS